VHDTQQFYYPHAAPSEFITHPHAFAYQSGDGYVDGYVDAYSEQPPPVWPPHIPDDLDSLVGWDGADGLIPPPRTSADGADAPPLIAPLRSPRHHQVSRRRRRVRLDDAVWPQLFGPVLGAITALTVIAVSVLGWVFTFDPLRELAASRMPHGFAQLWPLMVYGPWLVASLSILRAARERRATAHSWVVVVAFSGIAVGLCVVHATPTMTGVIIAGLPQLTAVVSFHQLVRQFTATQRARHAAASVPTPAKTR
jgi:hypothetical protein